VSVLKIGSAQVGKSISVIKKASYERLTKFCKGSMKFIQTS
jgi:hypothetical protein